MCDRYIRFGGHVGTVTIVFDFDFVRPEWDLPCKTAGKWQKRESYFGALTPWLAAWTGIGSTQVQMSGCCLGADLGGSAPHQCSSAGVVWAPRCHDFVMGCLRGLVVLH